MKRFQILILLCLAFFFASAQSSSVGQSMKQQYQQSLKNLSRVFSNQFYPNYGAFYRLPEKAFVFKIDSARRVFLTLLNSYQGRLEPTYFAGQADEIRYYFDRLLIDYPLNHDVQLGITSKRSGIEKLLKANLVNFNRPVMLGNSDFTDYAKSFLEYQVYKLRNALKEKNPVNEHLSLIWRLLPKYINNDTCLAYWKSHYLSGHIENDGTKYIETYYQDFKQTVRDTALLNRVTRRYQEDSIGKTGHLVKTYKQIGSFGLDMHLFLPADSFLGKRPVIVLFHGGSWSEGKPDWFFSTCQLYAKIGYVACAVEYRTYGRFGTLPFEAVKDARSAIRWLRRNANTYRIDTARIVATGNSAGGHLALCTALATAVNDQNDDLSVNPSPNLLLINAGVYDLTDKNTAWIRKDLADKDQVKLISPLFLTAGILPPTLLLHGTEDGSVPFQGAEQFSQKMKAKGSAVELVPIAGAGHFIWFDPKFSAEVSRLQNAFLKKHGY